MAEEKGHKKEESSHKKSKKNLIKKISKNSWTIATAVLAIALIATLIIGTGANSCGYTIITPEVAGEKVMAFATSQGVSSELIEVNEADSLYEVVLEIEGQEVPVYVTKDGKTLVPQPVPLDTQEKAATTQTQTQQAPAAEVSTKLEKPVVEAFIMSHCPYGTQIQKGLLPVVGLLEDKIDFEFKFVYYAMHPSYGEVEEQLNQYCIQKDQNDKYLDYLQCFLEAGDGVGCITETGIDTTALESCATETDAKYNVMANLEDKSSWLSGQFPKFDIHKSDNEKYGVAGSPTLVINGEVVQSGRDSNSLLKAICSGFENQPAECENVFEAVSPTPGFGFSTTESATNQAYCG